MTSNTIGIRELLRANPGYRNLWLAQSVSLIGDFFNLTALQTLVGSAAPPGASGRALGTLFLCYTLPAFVLGPVAGVIVDRHDRRRVMIACDAARALIALAFCLVSDREHLPLLYVGVAALFAFSAFFEPARSALLPDLVPREHLAAASELQAATWSISFALGASLGGLVTSTFGFATAFAVNAASFLGSALLVTAIGPGHGSEHVTGARAGFWADLTAGLSYIRAEAGVLALLSVKPAWCLGNALSMLMVIFGSRVFPLGRDGAVSIGLMSTARAVGTFLGPIASRALARGQTARMWGAIPIGYLVGALFAFLFSRSSSLSEACCWLVLTHLGGSTLWIFSMVLLQARVPGPMRGRVFATEQMAYTLAMGTSYGTFGLAVDAWQLSPRQLGAALAVVYLVPGLIWAASRALRPAPETF